MFPQDLAKLEEQRIALALRELSDEHLSVAGGVACVADSVDSWMNLVVGVGMHGPLSPADADRVVAFYRERSVSPKVEVCPFADPSLAGEFGQRGFRLSTFATVLSRDLAEPIDPPPEALQFEVLDPSDEAALEQFVQAHVACFSPDGGSKADAMAQGARRMAQHPRTTTWMVRHAGGVVGAAALEVLGPLGTLIAGGVLPAHRRRGIQRALIHHRCTVARERGCTTVTIGSSPQSATGRNAFRAGFRTAYTKAVLTQMVHG